MAAPASAAPVLFTYTPTQPVTGQVVTFTSLIGGTITWDLDGDDACDDASGPVAKRSFQTAGAYKVKFCESVNALEEGETITVRNRPPTASFTIVPADPVAREPVRFTSTAEDPDGPIVAQQWDLDGDGSFDDKSGETALYFWRRAGTYPVALRVTDRDGASAVARLSVVVARRPLGMLSPAPHVRVVSQPTANGAHLNLLTITAPKGARVGIRCKGGNCPYKRKRFTSKGKRVTLRALGRNFNAGSIIEIRVTKPETLGSLTRLRIRAGNGPARLDRCIAPGRPNKPLRCPTG